ncbi:hypothetical protein P4S73_04550 [Paraglaciecola sp. Hal342]
MFKPTLTFGQQTFRPTKEGALSYFVGGNSDFPNDKGFKLKPWVKVWFSKEDFILHNDLAIVQCNVHFIGEDDSHIFCEQKFLSFTKNVMMVRCVLFLHQSSLPYQP